MPYDKPVSLSNSACSARASADAIANRRRAYELHGTTSHDPAACILTGGPYTDRPPNSPNDLRPDQLELIDGVERAAAAAQ